MWNNKFPKINKQYSILALSPLFHFSRLPLEIIHVSILITFPILIYIRNPMGVHIKYMLIINLMSEKDAEEETIKLVPNNSINQLTKLVKWPVESCTQK